MDDFVLWDFARDNNFVVVTKDADFSDICAVRGHPLKVIWLRIGNCTTSSVEAVLRSNFEGVQNLEASLDIGVLSLF